MFIAHERAETFFRQRNIISFFKYPIDPVFYVELNLIDLKD